MHSARGFTLIELMVVIAITAILGIVAFVNFKDFAQNQVLNKAVGQIQTYLRLAQANATAGVLCSGQGGASWSVKFVDDTTLKLTCGSTGIDQKNLDLDENARIDSIKCSPASSECPQTGFNAPLTVNFAPLDGKINFSAGDSCINTASTLLITLKNLKNNSYKCFTISKGGAIDVQ